LSLIQRTPSTSPAIPFNLPPPTQPCSYGSRKEITPKTFTLDRVIANIPSIEEMFEIRKATEDSGKIFRKLEEEYKKIPAEKVKEWIDDALPKVLDHSLLGSILHSSRCIT
jgi:hypothetical protein